MAGLNDDAQWIVLLGFIISILILFLALIVNQSALVGQTTAESVLEFPKTSIQDTRNEVMNLNNSGLLTPVLINDIEFLSMERRGAVVIINDNATYIHFNNGITTYNESIGGG
jgi:hypothetical protein